MIWNPGDDGGAFSIVKSLANRLGAPLGKVLSRDWLLAGHVDMRSVGQLVESFSLAEKLGRNKCVTFL